MTRPIYDPTSCRLLPASTYQALDESGLVLVQSPATTEWFALDPWTWTSRRLDELTPEQRASCVETIRQERGTAPVVEVFEEPWGPAREPGKAAGGVLIDAQSRVLLRAPRGAFGGYVWTFPKGRVDPGETWPMTALREVEEETGWAGRIVGRIGDYKGDTSITRFYLMKPIGRVGEPDAETDDIAWVRPERAVQLLSKTRTVRGRERDLRVLRDALALHDEQNGTELSGRVAWSISRVIGWPDEPDAPVEAVRIVLPASLLPA